MIRVVTCPGSARMRVFLTLLCNAVNVGEYKWSETVTIPTNVSLSVHRGAVQPLEVVRNSLNFEFKGKIGRQKNEHKGLPGLHSL